MTESIKKTDRANRLNGCDRGEDPDRADDERVQKAVDALREKYGEQAARWGKEKKRGES